VRREATLFGVEIAGTEIVGLVPEAALDKRAEYFPLLENFTDGTVLENRIKEREQKSAE
jgi:glutamate formiminotransferase